MKTSDFSHCDLLDRLAEEFVERYRRGEAPSPQDYAARHPELANDIQELFPALVRLEHPMPDRTEHTQQEQVGGYRIVRELGRGGMGVVYEAEQVALGRRVALKVLHRQGARQPRAVLRFHREARAAARLHHTNIVPVFEAGQYSDVFFYAMQLIPSLGLDRVLQEVRRLRQAEDSSTVPTTVPEAGAAALALSLHDDQFQPATPTPRVEDSSPAPTSASAAAVLLATVGSSGPSPSRANYYRGVAKVGEQAAEALAYAHARGVVHRDVKPSNLLLDAQGVVWVADFGLAKAADSEDLTNTGDVVGTPRYMAPERFAGQAGAPADVYGLGLTLYELLTLRPAFEEADRIRLIEQIKNEEPPRPRLLDRSIPRDLETIVVKATSKDPSRRYTSAQELADDLRRWQAGEPVKARPVGPLARSWRWARRNPVVAISLAAVLLALAAGTVVSALFAVEANRRAAAESRARRQTREALDEMSSQVIEDWLKKQGRLEPAQRDFLEKVLKYYEAFAAESGTSEEVRQSVADAHLRVGKIHCRLGQHAEGEAAYRRALELGASLANDFPSVPGYRRELARVHNNLGILLRDTGRPQQAELAYRDGLALQKQLADEFPTLAQYRQELASTQTNLGRVLNETGRAKEAEAAYRDALTTRQQLVADFPAVPEYRVDLARTHNNLGVLLMDTGHPKEAEIAYREVLAIRTQLASDFPALPEHRLELARSHFNLAQVLYNTGRTPQAETAYRDALAIQKKLAADFPAVPEYRSELARSDNSLGILLAETGRRKDAEAAWLDALALQKQLAADLPTVPAHRFEMARIHNNLGMLQKEAGRPKQAEASWSEALALYKALAAEFPAMAIYRLELAGIYNNQGNLLKDTGHPKDAEKSFQDALRIQKRLVADYPAVPDYQIELANTMAGLAELAYGRKDYSTAHQLLEQAQPHVKAALDANPRSPVYRAVFCAHRQLLAATQLDLGDHAAAAEAAADLARVAFEPVPDAYKAACFLSRCTALADQDAKLSEARRKQLVQSYPDQAMAALRQAVAKGYKDAAQMKKDKDLDPLRGRPDFQKLLAELDKLPQR
jgi:serine/threonine protein kinase